MSFGTKQSRYWWRNTATIKIETFLNINLASHIIDIFSQLGYKWAFHTSWQKEGKEMKCFQPNFTCGTLTLHFTIKNHPYNITIYINFLNAGWKIEHFNSSYENKTMHKWYWVLLIIQQLIFIWNTSFNWWSSKVCHWLHLVFWSLTFFIF